MSATAMHPFPIHIPLRGKVVASHSETSTDATSSIIHAHRSSALVWGQAYLGGRGGQEEAGG